MAAPATDATTTAETTVLPVVPAADEPGPGTSTRRVSSLQGLTMVILALVLVVGMPIAFVDWTRNSGSAVNTGLCLVLLAISAWRITEAIAMPRQQVLRSLFYVFVYVFLAMPALAQSVSGTYPLDGLSYKAGVVSSGLVHFLVGVVAYELGWALRREKPAADDGGTGLSPRPRLAFSRLRCLLVGLLGLVFTAYQLAQYGVAVFFTSRSDTTAALTGSSDSSTPFYTTENKTSGLVTVFLSQFLVFVALFGILYSRRHRLWPKQELLPDALWRLFIGLLIAANLIMNNPMGNGRWWFCLVAVGFFSIYLPYDRRNSQRLYVTAALLLLIFSFASLDLYRYDSSTLQVAGPSRTLVENGTYAMFQMELNGVRYVDDVGHTQGQQLLGSVLGFVPRGLWDDKPIPTGQVVDPQYARSATAWTEAQVDFGIPGVVVFFMLYGAASRELTIRGRRISPGMLHATLPILAAFQIFLLRGSLQPAIGALDQLVVAFALVMTVHPVRRAVTAPPPADSGL